MKITFLGTAAAEGFPAIFCNCEHCREALLEDEEITEDDIL